MRLPAVLAAGPRTRGLTTAFGEAGCDIVRGRLRLSKLLSVPVRDLAVAGLTASDVRRTAAACRSTGQALPDLRVEVLGLARLVAHRTHGLPPRTVVAAAELGCLPELLASVTGWPSGLGRPLVAEAILAAARAQPGGPGRIEGGWHRLAITCSALHTAGASLTVDRQLAWGVGTTAGRNLTGWVDALPPGIPIDRWLDATARWAEAGLHPADGLALFALPVGHPDLPGPADLAVMASLGQGGPERR